MRWRELEPWGRSRGQTGHRGSPSHWRWREPGSLAALPHPVPVWDVHVLMTVKWECRLRAWDCWPYFHSVYQHLKVGKQFPHLLVKNHQLSLLHRKLPVWIRGCDHGPLAGSNKCITGNLHIKGETKQTTRKNMNIFEELPCFLRWEDLQFKWTDLCGSSSLRHSDRM